jgi:hypothetical protein
MSITAFLRYRHYLGSHSTLMRSIYRDGLLYMFGIMSMNTIKSLILCWHLCSDVCSQCDCNRCATREFFLYWFDLDELSRSLAHVQRHPIHVSLVDHTCKCILWKLIPPFRPQIVTHSVLASRILFNLPVKEVPVFPTYRSTLSTEMLSCPHDSDAMSEGDEAVGGADHNHV